MSRELLRCVRAEVLLGPEVLIPLATTTTAAIKKVNFIITYLAAMKSILDTTPTKQIPTAVQLLTREAHLLLKWSKEQGVSTRKCLEKNKGKERD